jgi:hypothetical protein
VSRALWVLLGLSFLSAECIQSQEKRVSHEWGAQVTGVTGRPAFLGAGPSWAWRPGLRDRLMLHGAAGSAEHQAAVRLEASWHFMLSPQTRKGLGAYVGGGIAGQFAESNRGWLLLTAGVEQSPAAGRGWFAEAGIGGGVRIAIGFRWRR